MGNNNNTNNVNTILPKVPEGARVKATKRMRLAERIRTSVAD